MPDQSGWDYEAHPGDCCPADDGLMHTVHCRECAGTGVFPVPWIDRPVPQDDTLCVACKGSGRAIVGTSGGGR